MNSARSPTRIASAVRTLRVSRSVSVGVLQTTNPEKTITATRGRSPRYTSKSYLIMASIPLRASPQLLRSAQACDHGHPQQVLVGAGLVGCDLRQAAAEIGPVGLEVALVLDRLFLDVFECHQAALPVVTLKLGLGLAVMPDLDEARGQVDRVVNAAVHAHAAERIVDMRGVAGEERPSALERLRHPLVHLV